MSERITNTTLTNNPKTSMLAIGNIASVPAVSQYLRSAQALNIDCAPLLDKVGINPDILENNENYISGESLEALISLLIAEVDDPCFGLHTSQFVEAHSFSVLGYIALNCSSLRTIQARISIYEKIVGDMGVTSIEYIDKMALQTWHCQFEDPVVRRHQVENVLGSWVNYSQQFLNIKAYSAIWFEHSAPKDPQLLKEYQKTFNCPVLFDQHASGILFEDDILDKPLPQANSSLLKMLLEHATEKLAKLDKNQPTSLKVKNLLKILLKKQAPSSAMIADKLNMSSRTLQRKLEDEGTQYKTVLNELRLEMAVHYLKETTLTLDQISYELGYSEPRSFYRSFKLWTGITAGAYRAQSRTL